MPPPPPQLPATQQTHSSHSVSASQPCASDLERFDTEEMPNNNKGEPTTKSSRGHAQGGQGGQGQAKRGLGARGRGNGGAKLGLDTVPDGVVASIGNSAVGVNAGRTTGRVT